jgi:hypothetical protein
MGLRRNSAIEIDADIIISPVKIKSYNKGKSTA